MSVGFWTDVDRLEDPDSDYAEEAVRSASFILWSLTGRKYGGVRTVTEVYRRRQRPYDEELTSGPEIVGGEVVSLFGGFYGDDPWSTIRLRGTPVINVNEVRTGTTVTPLDQINIIDRGQISLVAGSWLSFPEVTVTYQYGSYPPLAGVTAATNLANQYLWATTGDDRCELPAHVTSVSRQGVSWTLLDTQDFFKEGRTGVYSVDLFITAVNPSHALLRPRVFSPDLPTGRTRRSSTVRAIPPSLPQAP